MVLLTLLGTISNCIFFANCFADILLERNIISISNQSLGLFPSISINLSFSSPIFNLGPFALESNKNPVLCVRISL